MEGLISKESSFKKDSQQQPDHLQPSQFIKSLQELKELRSQLHHAADYWEKSFLNAKQKKKVVDSTKEYVCTAVVAVVDHLGSVSTNLNTIISQKASGFSEAELRIDTLKQRFLAYELYAQKFALTRTRWCFNIIPKSHRRFLSTPNLVSAEKSSDEDIRDASSVSAWEKSDTELIFEAEDLPLFLYTYAHKASPADANISAVGVRDAVTICRKGQAPTFHFQQSGIPEQKKHGRRRLSGRSSGDIMALVRRSKRPAGLEGW
ncbi:unnamed protein product [Linum trigynum]|uniref:Protein ABIL5 n=1 Tax=Linum trigynum TaxID=586398 RepID=A0AAV2GVB0_9ROSI